MLTTGKINCIAVDDEEPALFVLEQHIAAVPSLNLIASCNNAVEALEILKAHYIDLLFLDIQMPQILGTDFVRTLKYSPKVIFTTAFRKYAVEGFELDAVDYLMKPISFERFLKAVNKAMNASFAAVNPEPYYQENVNKQLQYIHLREDRKTVKILLDDILYIESLKDYLKVVTKQKPIITKQSISFLEQQLSANGFLRIHRSFIVALNKVESYTNESIQIGKHELPISRSYRHEVEKAILK